MAEQHVKAAKAAVAVDHEGAYALAYDATRKSQGYGDGVV